MICFTSDTHFWHTKVLEYCDRPFASVEEMNEVLIAGWNQTVTNEDTLYFLGDFAFCGVTKGSEIFSRLNGHKHLIIGNHDHSGAKLQWESIHPYLLIQPKITYQSDDGAWQWQRQPIVLCHYPILSWDGMAYGSWMLHGHCHGRLPDNGSLRLDVGVDCHNYRPLSLEDIQAKMALRTIIPKEEGGF